MGMTRTPVFGNRKPRAAQKRKRAEAWGDFS